MDTEEEEPLHVPNVESSLRLEDNPATTTRASELQRQSAGSQCELESVAELDESRLPAPSAVSPVAEKEEEREGKGVVDVAVVLAREPEAAVRDEVGGGDLIAGEEKDEMLDAGDGIKDSSPIDGNREDEGVVDREEGHVAQEEKADVAEDAAVDDVMEEMEKADLSDGGGTAEGIEVAVAERQVAELAEEAGNEQKVVDDVQDQISSPEDKEVAGVAEERGIAEAAEVDGVTEQIVVMEETCVADVVEERGIAKAAEVGVVTEQIGVMEEAGLADMTERTGIMDESEVAGVAVEREMLKEKQVDNEVEQTEILGETVVVNMVEKSESLEEKLMVDVAERFGIGEETRVTDLVEKRELLEDKEEVNFADPNEILEDTGVVDMVEKSQSLEEQLVGNVSEQTENLEDTNAVRETGMAEVDTVTGEESEKAEGTETGNVVEDVEKAEGTEIDVGDGAEGVEAAEDTEMLDMTEEVEMEAAEETEDAEEVEDASKASGGKRKRGKNSNSKVLARAPSRKKVEEDVCFICFDGGDLVLCDRRGCPKAYHTACVGRDEAFFRAKGKWNCGWHLCSNCKKNAYYMCYTCTFSLCKGCIKDAVILSVRGNKGLCESCMNLIMLIERNEQAQVNFDDKSSWEYLFKDYWIDLKRRLSINSDELAQAKNPWKGSEGRAAKQESPDEHDFNDGGGSGSDGSSGNAEVTASKRRRTRSQSKSRAREGDSPSTVTASGEGASTDESAEWASKELLEVVMHMRNGDKSVLSRMELSQLILDYIQKHKLRDRRNKSYVICDTRLKSLFGKPRVGHIEMLNLLDPHIFFTKEDSQTDEIQGSVVDAEANQLEADWNSDAMTKTGKDKKRKTRKKGDARGLQSNLDDYAAIDMHNINLIYLRRNLVEDLIEDTETFHDKVVGSFVRIRISGAGQKQDLYRLVQVVGTNKVAETYRVGKRTTDFLLEILNLNKTEIVSIDIISNQEFTEDECKRLRQSIKCGLINRLTVGDIQEKAMAIQAVRVKDWLESEIMRLSHLRDRASEKGHRKELRECVEKLQILKTPEERQRRLEEIPEIHVDPNMDPSYESEEDEGEDDKRQDNYMRPRGSGFSRRGREPISPRKGGLSSSDSWSGTRNYSSMNRELSRNLSNKGLMSKGDDSVGAGEMVNENLWNLGRERETQPNSWDKPKTALSSEIGTRNTHSVVTQEPSSKVVSEISPTPLSTGVTAAVQINETEKIWRYQDPSGKVQGPFSMVQLRKWNDTGYFPAELKIWRTTEKQDDSILLTDALVGKFQKDPPVADNSFPKAQVALYGSGVGATLKQGMENQVGERSRFDQNHVAWSPQRTLSSSGQSAVESWKSQTEAPSSTGRPAPSSLEMPKYSRDAWGSDTNLPSPTPNQNPSGGAKGQVFESKWSPTPVQSSVSVSVANSFRGATSGLQPPTVVLESGSPAAPVVHSHMAVSGESLRTQVNAQASINSGADMKNVGVSLQNLVQPVSSHNPSLETHGWGSGSVLRQEVVAASSIPATGTQAWGNASAQKLEPNPSLAMPPQPASYGHWNDALQSGQNSAPLSTGNPAGHFPTGQPTMLASDSWRPTAPVQSNVQLPAPTNLPWGMAVADNQGAVLRQAPGNQSTGWGPMPGNQNMGWGAPVPANPNVNWGASSQGSAPVNPNPSWAAPGQGQMPGNANSGWTAPGNAIPGWAPPGQGPAVVNTSSGWVAPGQGATPGSANPGYVAPSGNSGMWGNEQNHNGDKFSNQRDRGSQGGDSGYGGVKPWSRQSLFGSGGGSSRSPFKGQRVCKFHESGHCKKGASCDYMHT
ncbi:Nucleic acid binding,zinc ion binding,DNA binding, putative isoform 2 [Theobroma cacao]|uniref:Nucleic acid binding,zinc ion binding,DNA binding, putative isoform 2 n=1 Tax=Theobroma cacao TaxID=3641 RepID=A0A061DZP0_THECC|nr:Nucleic acid binding,zinc ion binding,DNA binding, putative isoform 2 [Theobroma cacao]